MEDLLPTEDVEDGLARFDMQSMLQADDEISLTTSGGLSENETSAAEEAEELSQKAVKPTFTADRSTSALFELCCRAAERLDVPWPTPSQQQRQTRLARNYCLPKLQTSVKNYVLIFPDFLTELTQSWVSPICPVSGPLGN